MGRLSPISWWPALRRISLRAQVFVLIRDPVALLDAQDRIVDVNPAFRRFWSSHARTTPTKATGADGQMILEALPDLAPALDHPEPGTVVPLEGVLGGWAATVETRSDRRGRRTGRAVVLRDVQAERARERRLRYQADRDPLTGALNRRAFDALLVQALSEATGVVTLAFLDLDSFKDINDFYGHATGDAVLIETTARLNAVLREGDALGRMGGDEFAVALIGLDQSASAPVIARLRRALEPLHHVHAAMIRIEASVGTATSPLDGRDAHALMAAADAAMYRVKHARRVMAGVGPAGADGAAGRDDDGDDPEELSEPDAAEPHTT